MRCFGCFGRDLLHKTADTCITATVIVLDWQITRMMVSDLPKICGRSLLLFFFFFPHSSPSCNQLSQQVKTEPVKELATIMVTIHLLLALCWKRFCRRRIE